MLLGLPLPDSADNLGTEAMGVRAEQEVGDETHSFLARSRQPPDHYMPEDFRQKKPRSMRPK